MFHEFTITEKSQCNDTSSITLIVENINITAEYDECLHETIEDGYMKLLGIIISVCNNVLYKTPKESIEAFTQ